MSIRFSFRGARTEQRGFVLVSVLVIALLYFGLLELMLIESGQAMRNSHRFRSRIVAQILAENAAELAARNLVISSGTTISATNDDGEMKGQSHHTPQDKFQIHGWGRSSGVHSQTATVVIHGHCVNGGISITRTTHSQ